MTYCAYFNLLLEVGGIGMKVMVEREVEGEQGRVRIHALRQNSVELRDRQEGGKA